MMSKLRLLFDRFTLILIAVGISLFFTPGRK